MSDILNRLYQHRENSDDLAGCCLGYMHKLGQHGYLSTIISTATSTLAKTNNPSGKKRVEGLRGGRYIVDDLRFGFFGVGSQFIPMNNRLTLKLTKDSSRRFFTGNEMEYAGAQTDRDSYFHIANAHDATPHAAHTAHVLNGAQSATNLGNLDKVKTTISQFEIYYKVITPSAQIQDINRMLDVEGKYINIFYQEIHIRSEVHKFSNSKFTCNNVFGFNCPYVMILTLVRTDYVNGDFYRTPTYCTWEKIKQVVVKVNNVPLPVKIENKQDAYYHTRKALHLGDSENGDCIMVFEMNPHNDSHLKVLPKEMKKSVSIKIEFDTTDNVEVSVKATGLMNQVCKLETMQTTFKQLAI